MLWSANLNIRVYIFLNVLIVPEHWGSSGFEPDFSNHLPRINHYLRTEICSI